MDELKTIVLVEDNEAEARLTMQCLRRSAERPITLHHVTTLAEAIKFSREVPVDAFILDLGLPDSSGLDGIVRLKIAAPEPAIVVLTGHDDEHDALRSVRMGAQLFVPKHEIAGHMHVMLRLVRQAVARQKQLLDALAQAHIDPLTSIANRRGLDSELERRMADFQRHNTPFCLAMIDVDHFKQINDRFGHEMGDHILMKLASKLVDHTRKTDLCTRFGGEEFAIVMSMTKLDEALEISKRIVQCIPKHFAQDLPEDTQVTVSCGVAEFLPGDESRTLVHRADTALYAAKQQGRNQVQHYRSNLDVLDVPVHV
ncbi:diguanylate cyclase [Bremerella sp. JC817]|uniref:GGDEF domain-containing response regulator n=1 Tax=Bremerella sp. JC817 TaxID=3231756 RepID=UPI00345B1E89